MCNMNSFNLINFNARTVCVCLSGKDDADLEDAIRTFNRMSGENVKAEELKNLQPVRLGNGTMIQLMVGPNS